MNIPNIPSDNLYKFLALSSLITLILLTYFIKKTEFELADEEVKFIGELKIENLKHVDLNAKLESSIELNSQLTTELKQLSQKMNTASTQIQALQDRIRTLENESQILSKSIDDQQKELQLLKVKNDTINSLIENKRFLKKYLKGIYSFSSIILFLLTLFGFYLWYQKVQKFQDRILKIQAKEVQLTSESSRENK